MLVLLIVFGRPTPGVAGAGPSHGVTGGFPSRERGSLCQATILSLANIKKMPRRGPTLPPAIASGRTDSGGRGPTPRTRPLVRFCQSGQGLPPAPAILERAAGKASHGKKDREPICALVKADNPELAAAMQHGACAAPIWGCIFGVRGFCLGCRQSAGGRQRHSWGLFRTHLRPLIPSVLFGM